MKLRVTNGKRIRTIDEDKLSRAKKYGWELVEVSEVSEVVEETDTDQTSEEEEN